MKLLQSASVVVLALTAGPSWAVQVDVIQKDTPTPTTTVTREDIEKLPLPNSLAPLPQTPRETIAHGRTLDAARKAQQAKDAAAAALCGKDKALQRKTADAAAAAQRVFEAVATEEVEEMPDVKRAHDDAIDATAAQQGNHSPEETKKLNDDAASKWDAYDSLKASRKNMLMDAALKSLNPVKNAACPQNNGLPTQRDANAVPNIVPPLPATPGKALSMLNRLNDASFKATLAEPQIRGRAEFILGLEGCNWSVTPGLMAQSTPKSAAVFLNRLNTPDLRIALSDSSLQSRVDALWGRGYCGADIQPDTPPLSAVPPANNPNTDEGFYPYGLPQGDYGRRPGDRRPEIPNVPGTPYGVPSYNW